ncbi:conserved protein of unknown function [Tepidanaerobacter acetatoxydans Re1]|uniref:Uncharacterized protein n=1 Tax=Tepidanaerobacter acetatoxydans (strain DSM 21804 / JCM 16047 / Re1) TaxID=1209989 RepID=F4LVZ9_TEPAE|nr:hypothetical protein [Tepidanaerobacter acetatoxydans]AEE91667.1 hypothetical protein TepRe1_1521 [Tepidanaerobacter acetatoxydans Re1]CCP26413.1 conserved protein of unknown function [Tepidanaerobacter acetatoxydans Re1]
MNPMNTNQNTGLENSDNNFVPISNPYTLFLILLLLIISFGALDRMIKIIRSFLLKEAEE